VQNRADEPDEGVVVWEDADDLGPPFDLAVEPFEAIGRVDLDSVLDGKAHIGEHIVLGLVHEGGEFGELRSPARVSQSRSR
jgi:hypothetical protein